MILHNLFTIVNTPSKCFGRTLPSSHNKSTSLIVIDVIELFGYNMLGSLGINI